MKMTMTDEELVAKITSGQAELFGEIIERYEKPLFRYVKRLINQSETEVEDVVEETLAAAYKNLNSYKNSWKFKSWIYRIGHNKAVDWMRNNKIKTETIEAREEMIGGGEEEMEEELIRREEAEVIHKLMGQMPRGEREILELYYFEDLSYEDVADVLNISTNNVAVRLLRAKKRLKFIWHKYEQTKK